MDLREYFLNNPRMAVGLSGGTDSAFLLWAVTEYADDVLPLIAKTPFLHKGDLESALEVCDILGLEPVVIDIDVCSVPEIMSNDAKRCYYCKRHIFSIMKEKATGLGYDTLADGTNASDDVGDRPGYMALCELGIVSPLRECGLRKDDIRRMSREIGLPTWNRPSNSCLATRMITDVPIDIELLRKAEMAENDLSEMGYVGHRVRVDGSKAVIRLPPEQIPQDPSIIDIIIEKVERYIGPAYLGE